MGLFGSKKKIVVFSQTAHLMEVDDRVSKDAVLYAVLRKQSISKTLVNTHLSGIGTKMAAAMVYARDHYVLGLPNNYHSTSDTVADSVLAQVVTDTESLPFGCIIKHNLQASMSAAVAVYPFLLSDRGYVTNTDHIKVQPPGWVLPTEYAGHSISILILVDDVEETTPTTVTINYVAEISYRSKASGSWQTLKVPLEEFNDTFSEVVPVPDGLLMQRMYYIAGYKVLDVNGIASDEVYWWYYSMDSGAIPELNQSIGDPEGNESYPVIPIRYQNQFISETNSPEVYRTGKELLRRMNMSFDDLVTSLDENPGIGDIDNAYVTFGVDLQSDDPTGLAYLVDFFTWLSRKDQDTIWDNLSEATYSKANYYSSGSYVNASGVSSTASGTSMVINPNSFLSMVEHGLRTQVSYQTITSYLVRGTIGEVGHATKTITVGKNVRYASQKVSYGRDTRTVYQTRPGTHTLTLRHQLSVGTYRQVTVTDLTHHNDIYRTHGITTTLSDVAYDTDEHNMIIPLHHGIVKGIPMPVRTKLYQGSILLSIIGYDKIKLKWYQLSIFKQLITVVGFAIAVYSLGTGSFIPSLIAAIGTGLAATMVFILYNVIIAKAVQYATQILAEELGPELAMAMALVAMASGQKFGGQLNFAGMQIPTAQALTMVGTGMMSGSVYAQGMELMEIQEDADDLTKEAKEKQEAFEDKVATLFPEGLLPFSYLDVIEDRATPNTIVPVGVFHELPYIQNIGDLAIDMVNTYVDTSLELPRPSFGRI